METINRNKKQRHFLHNTAPDKRPSAHNLANFYESIRLHRKHSN